MKIGEPNALTVKLVEDRSFDHGISVRCDFAVTLIIRDDDDDVRFGCGLGKCRSDRVEREGQATQYK